MYCKQLLDGRSLNWILILFFTGGMYGFFFFFLINVLFKCEVLIM